MFVCTCVSHSPALLAFHTAELHMPTSRQKAHMADMQLSVKEAKTKHNLKSAVEEDKEVGLICQQDEKKVDRISVSAFSVRCS